MITPGFIAHGLSLIADALDEADERAGLTLGTYTISEHAARQCRASLRALETLLRRIILLMAAGLAASSKRASRLRDPNPLPEGTIVLNIARLRGFVLVPITRYDPGAVKALNALPRASVRRPAKITLLRHRLRTLRRHLKHPERIAQRMANRLTAEKAAGAPRPICITRLRLHRPSRDLEVFSDILPSEINDAYAGWHDSG
ncbi:hypothetical protein [Henriciella litoralis]|uniref:hypothetical protein n=1 Tax=Henriciella litoralis TaxID=568102 RepID=UPI000A043228|nr:hypothetical protein [Henriciella litoralis]